jgi:glutamine synthetase
VELDAQREILGLTTEAIANMKSSIDALLAIQEELEATDLDERQMADAYCKRILPGMLAVREVADLLERLIDDDLWPLPKYREMLFIH